MKRREKVKDIVEVRPFKHLSDFAADPGLTLSTYRFTDITSDLMGKWVDRIADVRKGHGEAFALAGLRGVGKSHFISVLAALVTNPELRTRIDDPHVLARTERLSKRHVSVAFVRRGSGSSLLDELRSALSRSNHAVENDSTDSLYGILLSASESAGEPPLIFIDTAWGREARVDRDDGAVLSEIAEAAKSIGIFVGIALDDDISGADGPNSSIARSYHIDFLDQEHLHKIVDRHIFAKEGRMLAVLKDIYSGYQQAIPGFRWSEQRFVSLYPMHPATLEISPLIRLFVHDFALLGFASEAGVKILGRPADSLIGLDEMFGSVESRLRKVPELQNAFRTYDTLEREVISKTPFQFRLHAKLALQGLMLLSLDGQGATAASIAASMLIFEEGRPQAVNDRIQELLDSIAERYPDDVSRTGDGGPATQYRLKIGINDGLDHELEQLVPTVNERDIWESLLFHISERFPESQTAEGDGNWSTRCTVGWRGGLRRGEIIWRADETESGLHGRAPLDWSVTLGLWDQTPRPPDGSAALALTWAVSPLTNDERETVAKYHILKNNPGLRDRYKETAATSLHVLTAAVEKITQRSFSEGALIGPGKGSYSLSSNLGFSHDLSHFFSEALSPVFERQYPDHPVFERILGFEETCILITDLFGGANVSSPSTQALALSFAEPLGLVERGSEGFVPASKDVLYGLPTVQRLLELWKGEETVSLSDLARLFNSPPLGLTREAQQVILSALVSQREAEFVTATGNRINHRSLDLQIIWDDIVGIAKPAGESYATEKLILWARTLTGDVSIKSLSDKELIDSGLHAWLARWDGGRVLDEYDRLSDESLNANSWKTAFAVKKSLSKVADIINSYLVGNSGSRECFEAIADVFVDSEDEYLKSEADLIVVREFTARSNLYQTINSYLVSAELTQDPKVEQARSELLGLIRHDSQAFSSHEVLEQAWNNFRERFAGYYDEKHRNILSTSDRQPVIRSLMESPEWQVYEMFSSTTAFDRSVRAKVDDLITECRESFCDRDPVDALKTQPYCSCGFRLRDLIRIGSVEEYVIKTVAKAVDHARGVAGDRPDLDSLPTAEDEVVFRSASLLDMS